MVTCSKQKWVLSGKHCWCRIFPGQNVEKKIRLTRNYPGRLFTQPDRLIKKRSDPTWPNFENLIPGQKLCEKYFAWYRSYIFADQNIFFDITLHRYQPAFFCTSASFHMFKLNISRKKPRQVIKDRLQSTLYLKPYPFTRKEDIF